MSLRESEDSISEIDISEYRSQYAVSNNGFLMVRFGLVRFINCLDSESFVVSFSYETEKLREVLVTKQIVSDFASSWIVIHIDNLLDEICKLVNTVSYVSQQRGSPWLFASKIFHNISCLLELRGVYILMHLVQGYHGVESGVHSYCCDFGKSLLNNTTWLWSSPIFH